MHLFAVLQINYGRKNLYGTGLQSSDKENDCAILSGPGVKIFTAVIYERM